MKETNILFWNIRENRLKTKKPNLTVLNLDSESKHKYRFCKFYPRESLLSSINKIASINKCDPTDAMLFWRTWAFFFLASSGPKWVFILASLFGKLSLNHSIT